MLWKGHDYIDLPAEVKGARRDTQDVGNGHVWGMGMVRGGCREVPREEISGCIRVRDSEGVWHVLAAANPVALRSRVQIDISNLVNTVDLGLEWEEEIGHVYACGANIAKVKECIFPPNP